MAINPFFGQGESQRGLQKLTDHPWQGPLQPEVLAGYEKQIRARAEGLGVTLGSGESLTQAQALQFYEFSGSATARGKRFVDEQVDLDDDGQVSLTELIKHHHLMDIHGDGNGGVSIDEFRFANQLNTKNYLMDEAERLGLSEAERANLESRLASDQYTTTYAVGHSFDLSLSNTMDREANMLRSYHVGEGYDEYSDEFSAFSPEQLDEIRQEALKLLASDGSLPRGRVFEGRVLFSQALAENLNPAQQYGPVELTARGYRVNFESGELEEDEHASFMLQVKDPDSYRSSGTAIQTEMKEKVDRALLQPVMQQNIRNLRSAFPGEVSDDQLRGLLLPINNRLELAYGIEPVTLVISDDETGSSHGDYNHDSRTMRIFTHTLSLNYQSNVAALLDNLNNPTAWELIQAQSDAWDQTIADLVGTVSHELGHADQQDRADGQKAGFQLTSLLPGRRGQIADRVRDYQENRENYNVAGRPAELYGMMGEENITVYSEQPLEVDAHVIGDHATDEVLKILRSGSSGGESSGGVV